MDLNETFQLDDLAYLQVIKNYYFPFPGQTSETYMIGDKWTINNYSQVSNNDTKSNFLKEQNQNCSRPQAFACHLPWLFQVWGKMLPQHPVGIVLENVIINYILLMIFNFY